MHARLLRAANHHDVEAAAEIIGSGGIVVLPTDTLYGIAASIEEPEAVQRVFEAKRRPPDRLFPWLVASIDSLQGLVEAMPADAILLADAFWPGGLTFVLSASPDLPSWVTGGSGSIGVRVPRNPTCLDVLRLVGTAVSGTSANVSGRDAAPSAEEAMAQLGDVVDAILEDDARVGGGLASTVLDMTAEVPVVLRAGAVSAAAISAVLGREVHTRTYP